MYRNPMPVTAAVDGQSHRQPVLDYAIIEARARTLPLRIVHTFEWPASMLPPHPVPVAQSGWAETVAAARAFVNDAVDVCRALAPDLEVTGEAIEGHTVQLLLDESAQSTVLVLGSRQLGALTSFFLGSVGQAVIEHGHCPVIVMRGARLPAAPAEMNEVRRIVVGAEVPPAAELGPTARTVLDFAFDTARRRGLGLDVVSCWRPNPFDSSNLLDTVVEADRLERLDLLTERLRPLRDQYPDVDAAAVVLPVGAVAGLVAHSAGQELLIVGRHRYRGIGDWRLGSVALGILHHAQCPVAVVPASPIPLPEQVMTDEAVLARPST